MEAHVGRQLSSIRTIHSQTSKQTHTLTHAPQSTPPQQVFNCSLDCDVMCCLVVSQLFWTAFYSLDK